MDQRIPGRIVAVGDLRQFVMLEQPAEDAHHGRRFPAGNVPTDRFGANPRHRLDFIRKIEQQFPARRAAAERLL